jgi:hypothetical protein
MDLWHFESLVTPTRTEIKQEKGRKEKTNQLSFSLSPVPSLDDDAARRRTSLIATSVLKQVLIT